MVLIKFHKLENHHHNSKALSDFRSKTSNFFIETLSKQGKASKFMSQLAWFQICFELINFAERAFKRFVIEIDYPMSQWGGKAIEEYLNYTLNMMTLLNSITSSISNLKQAKMSIFHALSMIEKNSPNCAAKYLEKIQGVKIPHSFFEVNGSNGIEKRPGSDKKELLILEALEVLKKIGYLALGLVLSSLNSDSSSCLEIVKFPGGCGDPLKTFVDSWFYKEMIEMHSLIEELNRLVERVLLTISAEKRCGSVGELNGKLMFMECSIKGVEKLANNLFSEVLAARNKMLDNIRFIGQKP